MVLTNERERERIKERDKSERAKKVDLRHKALFSGGEEFLHL